MGQSALADARVTTTMDLLNVERHFQKCGQFNKKSNGYSNSIGTFLISVSFEFSFSLLIYIDRILKLC